MNLIQKIVMSWMLGIAAGWSAIIYPPPSPPLVVNASDGTYTDKVRVFFSASTGAETYRIYRSSGGLYAIQIGTSITNVYEDTSAEPGMRYIYRVKACNTAGCSPLSEGDSGYRRLSAPIRLQATDGTYSDKVVVRFGPVEGAERYEVLRQDAEISGAPSVSLGFTDHTYFTDTQVEGLHRYYYVAVAWRGTTKSERSEGDEGYASLSAPSGIEASDGTYADRVHVTGYTVSGADHYKILRGQSNGVLPPLLTQIADVATADFNDTTAQHGIIYSYSAMACRGTVCSAEGDEDSGFVGLTNPQSISASDGLIGKIVVSGYAGEDASRYIIYREEASAQKVEEDNASIWPGSQSLLPSEEAVEFNVTTPTFEDTTAVPGIVYRYWAKRCFEGQCSDVSDWDTGYTAIPPVSATASDGWLEDRIRVCGYESPWASYYRIYRTSEIAEEVLPGAEAWHLTLVAETNTTAFDDRNVSVGTVYYYAVKACRGTICSARSEINHGYRWDASIHLSSDDGLKGSELKAAVVNYLVNKGTFAIDGTFGSYDFEDASAEFDWAYTALQSGMTYQLLGNPPTATNVFGWKPVSIEAPQPQWYMIDLGADVDHDCNRRFDWVLVSAAADTADPMYGKAYKLKGVTPDGRFEYAGPLDILYDVNGSFVRFYETETDNNGAFPSMP